MNTKFRYKISAFLLAILAWSCFGLNIGMISHDFMMHTAHEHAAQDVQPCCGNETQDTEHTSATASNHHSSSIVLANGSIFMLLLLAWCRLLISVYIHDPLYKGSLRLAIRERWCAICHKACIYRRLFSDGILNPRVY